MEAISAMPAAAAGPVRNVAGRHQNTGKGGHDARRRQREQQHGGEHMAGVQRAQRHGGRARQCRQHDVPAPLAAPVGADAVEQQRSDGKGIGNGREQADLGRAPDPGLADDGGQPEADGIGGHHQAQVDHAQQPDPAAGQRRPQRMVGLGQPVAVEVGAQHALVARRQPLGRLDAVGQVDEDQQAQHHRGNRLQEEQPLPARMATHAGKGRHDPARQRRPDQAGQRQADQEQRHDLAAHARGIPVGQVQHDAGKEPRLGHAQQKAQHIELHGRAHEHGRARDQAPGDHDPRDPQPRAHARQHQVAGHLEEDVAHEEQARTQAVDRLAEAQVLLHLQLGQPHVDAVQIGGQVAQAEEGHEAATSRARTAAAAPSPAPANGPPAPAYRQCLHCCWFIVSDKDSFNFKRNDPYL